MIFGPADDVAWMESAACSTSPQSMFFIEGKDNGARPYAAARSVCDECPVADRCLAYALAVEGDASHRDRFGMWGGKTPLERADLSAGRARKCIVCDEWFTPPESRGGRKPSMCSAICARKRRADAWREREGDEKVGTGRHGTLLKYRAGCTCPACRGHASLRRAWQRKTKGNAA